MSEKVVSRVKEHFGNFVREGGSTPLGEYFIRMEREKWFECVKFLRDDPDCLFDHFIDLTVVDWPEKEERFEVVLHLRSMKHNHRIRVKTNLPSQNPEVSSLTPLYKGANWFEREAYDMYGVIFKGHPDLRRILLWEGFEGHPLRKDYPKTKRQCPIPFREDYPRQPKPFKERS